MKLILATLGLILSSGAGIFACPEQTVNHQYWVNTNLSDMKRGWNTMTIKVTDLLNQPVAGATVTVDYDMTDMEMNPPAKDVTEKGEGVYEKQVFLGMKGKWKFNIKITKADTQDKTQDIN